MFYFLLGSIFGSFGHVLVSRLTSRENFLTGRSRCDACQQQLAAYDLLPIVSYFILRGKCRHCATLIPKSILLLEIFSGLLLFFSLRYWHSWLIFFWLFTALLLSLEDFWTQQVDLRLLLISQIILLIAYGFTGSVWHLETLGLAVIFLGGLFLVAGKKIGLADLLLLLFWSPLFHMEHWLMLIIVASLSGLLFSRANQSLPFIPFLSFALVITLIIAK